MIKYTNTLIWDIGNEKIVIAKNKVTNHTGYKQFLSINYYFILYTTHLKLFILLATFNRIYQRVSTG